jgi:hypothetical protein
LEKIKKIIWKNTAIIYSVLKKKNYKAKFLISSILKKIKSTEIILGKKILNKKHKKKEKNSCWKHCSDS